MNGQHAGWLTGRAEEPFVTPAKFVLKYMARLGT